MAHRLRSRWRKPKAFAAVNVKNDQGRRNAYGSMMDMRLVALLAKDARADYSRFAVDVVDRMSDARCGQWKFSHDDLAPAGDRIFCIVASRLLLPVVVRCCVLIWGAGSAVSVLDVAGHGCDVAVMDSQLYASVLHVGTKSIRPRRSSFKKAFSTSCCFVCGTHCVKKLARRWAGCE
jgi:hypothetical protein